MFLWQGVNFTLSHKILGNLRVSVLFGTANSVTLKLGACDGAPRVQRLARIAAGTDDLDSQIRQRQSHVADLTAEIVKDGAIIRENEDAIRDANAKYTIQSEHTGGIISITTTKLSPMGEEIVSKAKAHIAQAKPDMAKLLTQRSEIEPQLSKLLVEKSWPLGKLPPASLNDVNPLVLTLDFPLTVTKSLKIGTIELALVDRGSAPFPKVISIPQEDGTVESAGFTVDWQVKGWEASPSATDSPLGKNCVLCLERQSVGVPQYAGVALGPKVSNAKDSGYISFRAAQAKRLADQFPESSLNGWQTENIGDATYETLSTGSKLTTSSIYLTVQDGRCLAYWYIGNPSQLTEAKTALGTAKVLDSTSPATLHSGKLNGDRHGATPAIR